MYCHIVRDKITGEEFLIPFCYSMIHWWHLEEYTDRQLIKKVCTCDRRRGKNLSQKDEQLLDDVEALQKEIEEKKKELVKLEQRLDELQELLITVEQLEIVK